MPITPKTRAIAYNDGPLRSVNNYQQGFYEIGAMRQALAHSEKVFSCWCTPIAQKRKRIH